MRKHFDLRSIETKSKMFCKLHWDLDKSYTVLPITEKFHTFFFSFNQTM